MAVAAGAFATAALVFVFIFLDRWLSRALDDSAGAAAVLAGGNLIVVALILIVLGRGKRKPGTARKRAAPGNTDFATGLAMGAEAAKHLRKISPAATLIAALFGIAIGARPELLNLVRTRKPRK